MGIYLYFYYIQINLSVGTVVKLWLGELVYCPRERSVIREQIHSRQSATLSGPDRGRPFSSSTPALLVLADE